MSRTRTLAVGLMLLAGLGSAAAQNAANDASPVRVRYIVDDVQAAIAFYAKLGFRLDTQSGPYFAALSRGGVQLLLNPPAGPGGASQPMPNGERPAPGGGWSRMVLDTPDLQGDVDRLRQEGVQFRNDIVVGLGGNQILLDDPSGNVIELFQPTLVVNAPR
jgi:catechol 2,3-dioxygenase-like lactoylglutathione lyase family enzyme